MKSKYLISMLIDNCTFSNNKGLKPIHASVIYLEHESYI